MIRAKEGKPEKILSFKRVLQYSQPTVANMTERFRETVIECSLDLRLLKSYVTVQSHGIASIYSRFMWIIWWLGNE